MKERMNESESVSCSSLRGARNDVYGNGQGNAPYDDSSRRRSSGLSQP